MADKVLIAMSGGVDSSVAAFLMQRAGHSCGGAIMELWKEGASGAAEDAKAVADRLEMPFHVMDASAPFRQQVVDYFIRNRLPGSTAVVCYNDEIANLLIRRLLENGIQVPKDVAVVSFDNSYYCQISPVPITSLAHKSNRPGRAAASLLMEIIHGAPPRSIALDWELTIRESG